MKKLTTLLVTTLFVTQLSFGATDSSDDKDNPAEDETKSPAAEPWVTGTFDITTNYMFRGISQTRNTPAFQGGLTFSNKTGFYFNIWGSNVYFPIDEDHTSTVEMDLIGGYTHDFTDNISWDINIDRYNYFKAGSLNYNELLTSLTVYYFTGQFAYSNDIYNTGSNGFYYNLAAAFDIPPKYIFGLNNMTISGGIGHSSLPKDEGLRSYNDYNIALTKTIGIYSLALQWTDTNHKSVDPTGLKNSKILATLTANF
ncbi:MAG TPA: TorF family putative porin [Gammaproteobacteria bacterium]|jgi:uncharacterized protein (TIGR02001 family)|nr:TorF family putative porin [Gammaproteobacteria bacterium]